MYPTRNIVPRLVRRVHSRNPPDSGWSAGSRLSGSSASSLNCPWQKLNDDRRGPKMFRFPKPPLASCQLSQRVQLARRRALVGEKAPTRSFAPRAIEAYERPAVQKQSRTSNKSFDPREPKAFSCDHSICFADLADLSSLIMSSNNVIIESSSMILIGVSICFH